MVGVAVGPVGPEEGVADGALVVGLARGVERAGVSGRRGGRGLVGVTRERRHGFSTPRETRVT